MLRAEWVPTFPHGSVPYTPGTSGSWTHRWHYKKTMKSRGAASTPGGGGSNEITLSKLAQNPTCLSTCSQIHMFLYVWEWSWETKEEESWDWIDHVISVAAWLFEVAGFKLKREIEKYILKCIVNNSKELH